jgi:hypothetical protein
LDGFADDLNKELISFVSPPRSNAVSCRDKAALSSAA